VTGLRRAVSWPFTRARHGARRPIGRAALIAVGFLFASSGSAYAYFSATGTGTYGLADAGALVAATNFGSGNVTTAGFTLHWTTPVEPAGATVTSDTITQTGGSPAGSGSCFSPTPSSPCSVTGLSPNATYTFTLAYYDHTWSVTTQVSASTATSTTSTTCDGPGETVTLEPGATYSFTIEGGGGGNGANNTPGGTGVGGNGAAGASVSGTLKNTNPTAVTLKVTIGCAGQPAIGDKASRVEAGGFGGGDNGGTGQNTGGGGGGSGGGTGFEVVSGRDSHVLAAAAGGGGGGGAVGNVNGGNASSTYRTSTQSTTAPEGDDGVDASCGGRTEDYSEEESTQSCGGSGAGGGGVKPSANAGTAGTATGAPGGGGTNGNSYVKSTTVTGIVVAVSGPVAGTNPGRNGFASITETAGPPVFTSAASASFVFGQATSFEVTTGGVPTPTVTNASWTNPSPACTTTASYPSGLTFTPNANGTATIAAATTVPKGNYSFCLQANNISGTAYQKFTLKVVAPPLSFAAIGTATTWTSGTHGAKSVAFPSTVTAHNGDLLLLVVVGNESQGGAGTPTGWQQGDLGNPAHGTHPHADVFWRQHTTSTTSVSVTPNDKNPSAAAWVVAYSVTGTLASATADRCGAHTHVDGTCGYASASSTLTISSSTNVTTSHATAVVISLAMTMGDRSLSVSTPNGFTFRGSKSTAVTSSAGHTAAGDALGAADQFVATTGSASTQPVWNQTGTAATWAWATLAFDPPTAP